ncbi:MAG: GNAT family N-acetyltransferase [Flavobacteriaceae bacterium]|jgi:glucosamine-phosphate N-acetyltransferase|nr:GNAT family N-acetyltransferase [Flavobacteriaceae bacterium]MBT4113306.1 GNAT family N-acetyltransferase [Flavobacteriaceae bacterium]MBT4614713.1 GNAT family N-acetyltransferase [Flavobacteriaceae bacterium]MBT5247089.1 GNAT family N-acetyltransferase [Flavobacteriaceae bacterium]MBT5649745.1 GNAT family N-acetyltransferase [Flavobacteriaceae bacterium]|tara:strand:+ start:21 stop:443 length:423 start_codon:yes stop_codon:yes gene_type:complete
MSEINFRLIKEEDINDVFILLNQLKKIDLENIDRKKAWNDFNSNTSSNSIVGIYNNRIVAYGSVVIENKIRGEVAGHIEDIVVNSEVRGKMVGVSLIKELIEISRRKGCYRITLFCNEKLVNFYSRNGFKVNNIIMKKYL